MSDAVLLTRSPCIGICTYNKHAICKGCRRTRSEVKAWKRMPEDDRHNLNLRVLATAGKDVRHKLLKAFRP